jgi:hypothetical protein
MEDTKANRRLAFKTAQAGTYAEQRHKERELKKNPLLKFLIITNPKPFYY